MKSLLFTVALAAFSFVANAQKLDKPKDLLSKNKLADARTEIDNIVASDKGQKNAEAWYLKAKVYTAIALDSSLKNTVPNARETAFESLKKYMDMEAQVKDSAKRYLSLNMDGRKPFADIYSAYSKDGASFYNAGNFNDALKNFESTLNVFDYMHGQKLTNVALDTTTVLYAGISAEKANQPDVAAKYYGKIAEAKAKAEGFEAIYKWLADHYKQKNNLEMAQKYLNLGKQVYPSDPFWLSFDLDMLSEKGTKEELFKKYEEVITATPNNHITRFNYGVELYKAGYDSDSTKRPANSEEMINKAIEQVTKSIEIKGDYPNSHMLLGQIYYNQGVDINNYNKTIRPQGGVKLKPEQLKKKEDLRKQMNEKFDQAIVHFEKVDELLGAQGKLKMEEKQFLKDSYDLLITIYEQKGLQDKATVYTEKFNNVDKVH
jgi:tetratricopeptide (TPR) repeat protein